MKRLDLNQIKLLCNSFIEGKGFPCYLDIDLDIIKYLKKYNYIIALENDMYILDKKIYKNYKKEIEALNYNKIEKELIKNYNPFIPIYFDGELMHLFLNNPNFHFYWSGYRGMVCSTEQSKLNIYIKDICLCYDLLNNRIVIGIFLVDLLDLDYQYQIMMQPYMLSSTEDQYEFHIYNIKNLVYGQWLEINEEDIYTVLLEGIKIINYIFEKKYGFKLYKKEYEINELQFFMPLFYPTKINWFNFCMEIYKLFLDNIKKKSIKKKIIRDYKKMPNKDKISMEMLQKGEYGPFSLFKIYFEQYTLFNQLSFEKLDKIRKLREEPAHKIYSNDLNYDYCTFQDKILKDLYRIINNIIKVEDDNYKLLKEYKNGDYICFYGKKGSISQINGFNLKPYRYYDGYLRLNNDKFQVRDAEIMIAGNDKEEIKQILINHISNYHDLDESNIIYIVNLLINNKMCIPTDREIKSFFYGNAYIKEMHNECRNFKSMGKKMYEEFIKKEYKFTIILADSSELIYEIEDTMNIIQEHEERIFGSGLLFYLLTNNYSADNSNIFVNHPRSILLLNNIWD